MKQHHSSTFHRSIENIQKLEFGMFPVAEGGRKLTNASRHSFEITTSFFSH